MQARHPSPTLPFPLAAGSEEDIQIKSCSLKNKGFEPHIGYPQLLRPAPEVQAP